MIMRQKTTKLNFQIDDAAQCEIIQWVARLNKDDAGAFARAAIEEKIDRVLKAHGLTRAVVLDKRCSAQALLKDGR